MQAIQDAIFGQEGKWGFNGMNPNQNRNQPPGSSDPAGIPPSVPQPTVGGGPVQVPPGIYPTPPDNQRYPSDTFQSNPISSPGLPPPTPVDDEPKHGRFHDGWRSVASTILLLVLAPAIALTLTAFAFQSYQVDGASMETTLQNNDRLIVNKIPRTISRITDHAYIPKRGDIIIFNQSGLYDSGGSQQKQLIKRVIGLPDDRVVIKDGVVAIYNLANPDGFNPDKSGLYEISAKSTPGTEVDLTIKDGEVFVLGDNRGNSEDSRYFGPVKAESIVGKLSLRVVPLDNIQKF